ncbi:S8 family serine peptidase [Agromyces intestinalis]|uniref:S8 family serine peptidase n=1 Tax=Agromyces intestinalis TaxID=2592652 RepID=A0A5C1YGZ0_9MICO|nr:S8 family serine peptidase [Agromyces intestinalis]QEO14878.1 S8 family serine peptidase [Agromyces intestinalis]
MTRRAFVPCTIAVALLSVATATAPGPTGASAAATPEDASCRIIPVEADGPHRSAEARAAFGVDGTGVTVGIISDSFATAPGLLTTPEQDVSIGSLPGPGNPCGYETPVEVLADGPGSDEGRAMAQLVHGIAPGARLLFATTGIDSLGRTTPLHIFHAVELLVAAGADIIVDDIGEELDLYFQQGITSAMMRAAAAADPSLMFFSSAGNDNVLGTPGTSVAGRPVGSWQTPAYRPVECPEWAVDGTELDCLDFSPTGDGDATYGVTTGAETQLLSTLLHWAEPMTTGPPTPSSFELRVYDAQHALVGEAPQHRTFLPVASFEAADGPILPAGDYEIVVARTAAADESARPAIWMMPFLRHRAFTMAPEYGVSAGPDLVGPTTYGHPAQGTAIGVGAADWTTPDVPEVFSSIGPGIELFTPFDEPLPAEVADTPVPVIPAVRSAAAVFTAAPLPEPIVTTAPQITGVDGTQTSFFGSRDDQSARRFSGTSASAPHVAAIMALAKSYSPATSREELRRLLLETATPMTNPYAQFGFEDANVIGTGLADAYALLAALPAPHTAAPTPPAAPTAPAAPVQLPASGPDPLPALAAATLLAFTGLLAVLQRRRRPSRNARAGRLAR